MHQRTGKEILEDLERTCGLGKKVMSLDDIRSPSTIRTFIARDIFANTVRNSNSLLLLFGSGADNTRLLDPSGICMVTRGLIEAHETLRYLCLDKISAEEREFRLQVYYLHEHMEQAKIIRDLGLKDDEHFSSEFGIRTSELMLQHNKIFLSLTEKQKKTLLTGRHAFFNFDIQIGRRTYSPQERAFYKILSNNVHATSLGIWDYRRYQSDILGFKFIMRLCLNSALKYAALALVDYLRIRPRISKKMPLNDKIFLKKAASLMLV